MINIQGGLTQGGMTAGIVILAILTVIFLILFIVFLALYLKQRNVEELEEQGYTPIGYIYGVKEDGTINTSKDKQVFKSSSDNYAYDSQGTKLSYSSDYYGDSSVNYVYKDKDSTTTTPLYTIDTTGTITDYSAPTSSFRSMYRQIPK